MFTETDPTALDWKVAKEAAEAARQAIIAVLKKNPDAIPSVIWRIISVELQHELLNLPVQLWTEPPQ